MLDPVKPLTCVTPKRAAALAVSMTFSAARRRTPSGSPSPHTSGGSVAPWRASMGSQTAWPTRWVLMAQQFRPLLRSISQHPSMQPLSEIALSTSKWSPQHASSSPSKPHSPHFLASSSSARSAHCPVKSVTGLATFQPPLTLSTSRTSPDPPLQLSAPRGQKRGHVDMVGVYGGGELDARGSCHQPRPATAPDSESCLDYADDFLSSSKGCRRSRARQSLLGSALRRRLRRWP